ncbi:hypothetical protein [Lichenihabitans psoromatis]|uniref:hypothetical protein n=1 Tax=Lichenihabitans psoromatis TaxID=2528642 RepID=UPI00103640A9|nr:hypothetical protein [Lichenihabitans psoromatis]
MKNSKLVMAGVALAFLSGGVASAFAQGAPDDVSGVKSRKMHVHGQAARTNVKTEAGYRPLTVGAPRVARVPTPAESVNGLGAAVASPFNGIAAVGGPIGVGGSVIGGAIGGATSIATAPLGALLGAPVGISNDLAPPLPIKARYAHTGPVTTTLDDGYAQEVPVDRSGPIYMIDNGGKDRTVTPFTLLIFPVTGAVSALTSPLRPAPVVAH